MNFSPDERAAILAINTGVVSDLWPPPQSQPMSPAPFTAAGLLADGWVMLAADWSGRPQGDGRQPLFHPEIVAYHCALRTMLAVERMAPDVADGVLAVAEAERHAQDGTTDSRRHYSAAFDAARHAVARALHADPVIDEAAQDVYRLLATQDETEALRL